MCSFFKTTVNLSYRQSKKVQFKHIFTKYVSNQQSGWKIFTTPELYIIAYTLGIGYMFTEIQIPWRWMCNFLSSISTPAPRYQCLD